MYAYRRVTQAGFTALYHNRFEEEGEGEEGENDDSEAEFAMEAYSFQKVETWKHHKSRENRWRSQRSRRRTAIRPLRAI